MEKKRCNWVGGDPLYQDYHDEEWGVPTRDPKILFEFMLLEGAQAGLSWITVLKKRAHYRQVFDQFDPEKIAAYSRKKVTELLQDPGIIRNRLKVNAAITNAQYFLEIEQRHPGGFSDYIWQFTDGKTIQNRWPSLNHVPVTTVQSDQMSKVLKRQGFKFIGSTICYAYMQAIGMVNDHTTDCFRHGDLA
ncbi:MAG: DNA-3-methyladenine glycosylase I [Gammaproteobacteria bacterium]|nr:DNA-3-methyladenine glycosylase I [Gammaproteobacteria bacterium]